MYLTLSGMEDDRIKREGSQHLPLLPIYALCLNVRWKHFVGKSLVVIGGGSILQDDTRQPLYTARSDIPWHQDTHWEAMMWWQWLSIHLVGQQHFRTPRLLDGNRAPKGKLLPAFVNSVQAEKSHVPHIWPDASLLQHIAQGHSSPDCIADRLIPIRLLKVDIDDMREAG